MLWIVGGLTIVICIVLAVLRGMKGPAYSLGTLTRAIKGFLRQGYNGGFLIIEVCHSQHFLDFRSKYLLEFRKYIHAPGDYGITLCLPNKRVKWSHEHFQKLQEFCDNRGITYSIAKEGERKPLEVFSIDCGKDSELAYDICKNIFLEVFELEENAKFFARLENGTIYDVLIDR